MMAETSQAPTGATAGQISAAVFGNALEFYDFTPTPHSPPRSAAPSSRPAADVSGGNAVCSCPSSAMRGRRLSEPALSAGGLRIGFTARPFGAYVIGRMGDRIGRRSAMLLSFTLMGVGLLGVVLPRPTPRSAWPPRFCWCSSVSFRFRAGWRGRADDGFLIEASRRPARVRRLVAERKPGIASLVGAVIAFSLSKILTGPRSPSSGGASPSAPGP